MISLAKLSVRRSKAALAAWLIVGIVLSLIGFGVSNSLSPSVTVVAGTQSSRAQQLADAEFGHTQLVPILLEGPRARLDRQGPPLVAALRRRPDTRVLSAFDGGTTTAGLRPNPEAALIVVSVDRSEKNAVRYDEPQIESLVSRQISAPVHSYISGQPSIDRAERNASLSDLHRDDLIAIGLVFILLLVGLRAPVAALLVAAVGLLSTLAGTGEVALLGKFLTLDPVGVAAGAMTGLALGVGFALLILHRFRREKPPRGGDPGTAATAALCGLETTGRAVLIAAAAIIVALALVAIIGPTQLLVSVGTGTLTGAAFATVGAVVVMPAAFVLLGRRIDAFGFPAPAFATRAWKRVASEGNWVVRHAVYAGLAATALLGVIALPAFALKTGPLDVTQLPPNSQARIAFQEISRVIGPGFLTPYNVIVVSKNGPITTPALLASIDRYETQVAQNETVKSVTGPGTINSTSTQLQSFGPQLKHSVAVSDQSRKNLVKLANGLGQAGAGSAQLQAGLATASSGAGRLQAGGRHAGAGASLLHAGLAQAQSGSQRLTAGLNQALTGAVALKSGSAQVLAGSGRLTNGLSQAQAGAKPVVPALNALSASAATSSAAVDAALSELQSLTTGKNDPRFASALNALVAASASAAATKSTAAGVASQAPALVDGINRLDAGAAQLHAGIERLHAGSAKLANGIDRLATAGSGLPTGLSQLTAGSAALRVGLGRLTGGAGRLATGLSGGVGPAGKLTTGLGQLQAAVIKSTGQIPSTAQLKRLFAQSPGIFTSGYFVLAAIEGATAANRNASTFTINLLRGGTAGQIVVVSRYKSSDRRAAALGNALAGTSGRFARANSVEVGVGGPAGALTDLTRVTKSRIWLDVAVITLAITLVLGLALRAVLLPIVATAVNVLVVAATFGVLQLLFGGSNPPMGGPGYLDPITTISVFALVIGFATVFTTVLLMRTREAYVAEPDNRAAVRKGLRETAAATTGAGLLMVAALIPFSTTELLNVRALGIGLGVSILFDVLVMRPVLLPAAETLLGRFGWWPTTAPVPTEPGTDPERRRSRPRLHHRRARPAQS